MSFVKRRRVEDHPDLNPDVVGQYLKQNPEVLDHHVTSYVSTDRVKKWLQLKAGTPPRSSSSRLQIATTNGSGDGNADKNLTLTRWKNKMQTSKGKLLQDLSRDFHHANSKVTVLLELAECVCAALSADVYTVYSCDSEKQELTHISKGEHSGDVIYGAKERVGLGTSVSAAVAFSKEPTRLKDLLEGKRHPDRLTVSDSKAHCVLALPLVDDGDSCFGVVEFYRQSKNSQFTEEEEEMTIHMLQWYDLLVDYVETHSTMIRQRTLSDFLLEVTKSIFQDIVSMDIVIIKIMNFAKALVHADRASLFLLDTRSNELYARIFDDGYSLDEFATASESKLKQLPEKGSNTEKVQAEPKVGGSVEEKEHEREKEKKKKPEWHNQDIRFSMDKGVAGYVASTGKILNIKDAYKDKRFNPEVDIRTGYKTKTILCMPIFIRGSVIGVVQMVNKINGTFTKSDEEAFETFAIYCGLALHHAKLYEKIRRSEQKYKVALDVLSYHSQATHEEVNDLKRRPIPDEIPDISRYDFSPWAVMDDEKPLYCLYMFRKLFSNLKYELEDLMRFTLTVKKNYRNVPYHNWTHAFSVAHSMFTVIDTAKHNLTPIESIALFVSCLCHDLDHRGKTNQFMVQSASPLAAIYSTSTMEHHHFNQTVTILQNEGHNIFKYLTSDEYKMVLSDIKQSILATDLAVFFKNKVTMQNILNTGEFNWDTIHHRNTLLAVSMTACDLCAMYKPWDVQQTLVYIIMEEFWEQGDEEKKRGLTPIQMMDRDRKDDLPNLEVGFIQSICVPCYELMSMVIPDTKPMLEGALANLHRWKEMAEQTEKEKKEQV
ncbi:hypothetical protein BsWGS_02368 [Bradybaena similaris]